MRCGCWKGLSPGRETGYGASEDEIFELLDSTKRAHKDFLTHVQEQRQHARP